MFTRLIYKLIHVIIDEVKTIDGYNVASTFEENNGYFDYERDAEAFIAKHKNDLDNYNGFYIIEAWVKDPTHIEQCFTSLFIKTYDKDGNLICSDVTYRFIPNRLIQKKQNDMNPWNTWMTVILFIRYRFQNTIIMNIYKVALCLLKICLKR